MLYANPNTPGAKVAFKPAYDNFIGGKFVPPVRGQYFDVLSPINGFDVPAPPEGSRAAMTDQQAGGSHVLYQDFVVPALVPLATLQFRTFVNSGDAFVAPATLDWATRVLNQQARVDLLAPGLDAFSLTSVLLNAFQTNPGDPLTSGYALHSVDVTSLLAANVGQTLRLRFAEVDNVSFLNFGVDDVRLTVGATAVPEPASLLLATLGLLALSGMRRRA